MITHIVLYKLRNKKDAEKLKDAFLSMRGKIEGLCELEAGTDFMGETRSCDVALVARFACREDLTRYAAHPVHLPVLALAKELVEVSHSVDFES